MIHMHWKLLGKLAVPCRDLMEWAHWFETANRHVAQTEVGPMLVSTVFLGLDHNFRDTGPPLLFETMVFGGEEASEWAESYCERTPDWAAAEAAHRRAVTAARRMLKKAQKTLQEAQGGPDGSEAPEAG